MKAAKGGSLGELKWRRELKKIGDLGELGRDGHRSPLIQIHWTGLI
jgi:hypothetical protein